MPRRMRNTSALCSWISQIVLEWLQQGCEGDLSADFRNFGASNCHFKVLLKSVSNRLFFRFGAEIRFGAAIPVLIMYKKVSLCKNIFL